MQRRGEKAGFRMRINMCEVCQGSLYSTPHIRGQFCSKCYIIYNDVYDWFINNLNGQLYDIIQGNNLEE